MARIRTIKPEVCTSYTVAAMSIVAQLLWERLWCFCDSAGRMLDLPRRIAGDCFPLIDDIDAAAVDSMLNEMVSGGLIVRYAAEGKNLIQVTNWDEHQGQLIRKNSEAPSRLPSLPAEIDIPPETSGSTAKLPPETSGSTAQIPRGECGIGNVERGKGLPQTPTEEQAPPTESTPSAEKRAVFRPPTSQEVDEYAKSANLTLDAGQFCDFYASKGWKVGSSAMKDWRAAVRNWARRDKSPPGKEAVRKESAQRWAAYDRSVSVEEAEGGRKAGYGGNP